MTIRAAIVAGLVFGAGALAQAWGPRDVTLDAPLSALPLRIGAWRGVNGPALDPEVGRVLRADDYVDRRYHHANAGVVALWVAFYASQRQGDAIHSPLNCLPGTGWTPLRHTTPVLRINGGMVPVNRYVIQKRGERQIVLYWYQGRGRAVASEYANKAYLLVDAVRYRRTDGALVRVTAPILGDEARADRAAIDFVAALQPQLIQPQLIRWLP
jgi:EpsI family protein